MPMKRPWSRREFLAAATGLAGTAAIPSFLARAAASLQERNDDTICEDILKRGEEEKLYLQPIGKIVESVGLSFIGAPYKGGTIEEPGEEHLVVNLREFDCVTFLESSLALARTIKLRGRTAADFRTQLRLIRYRDGIIQGYPSRLHYFSEWIIDHDARKIVLDLSRELGGSVVTGPLHYMTGHRDAYPRLSSNTTFKAIADQEQHLSTVHRYMIPRSRIAAVLGRLQSGDCIGITTATDGLDCSHTGLIAEQDGVKKFLHAPLSGGSVTLSSGSLKDYVEASSGRTGIVAARPLEPGT
ncbi:MAG: N-acetylmuramoyl-L-alanine amidase-like domain-containing protein [Bacteroidota bacterium]